MAVLDMAISDDNIILVGINDLGLETLSGGLRGHWKEGAWASFGSACRRLRV
jgi:hypothetical protein